MEDKHITITGLDIPFVDLVVFLVKMAFASIPALFIIYALFWAFGMLFGTVFSALMI